MEESKNIYQRDFTQKPALFTLIEAQNLEAVKQHLAENPADIKLKGWHDYTPLHIAAGRGSFEIVEFLLKNGADVHAKTDGWQATPLSLSNSLDITKLLMANGAKMDDMALDRATRKNRYEIIDYLLEHGAQINPQAPEYLNCRSVEAIKVYLKHGIDISGTNKENSNLLHELAWADLPEVFDFAYNNGVPWQKNNSRCTPYIWAKQGHRDKMQTHFYTHYQTLIAHAIKKVDAADYKFEAIRWLKPMPDDPQVFIALTDNADLIKYKIVGDRFVMDTIINIDLPTIRNFTFDRHGDIIVPTAEDELLLLDPQSFALKKTIETKAGLDFDHITYLPGKRKFIAGSPRWEIVFLDEDFNLIERVETEDGILYPIINENESLISFLSYSQATFYCLFQLQDDLKINYIDAFFNGEECSCGFAFHHQVFAVSYFGKLDLYRFENGRYYPIWSLDIPIIKRVYGQSVVIFISDDVVLFGKGRTLLFIDEKNMYKVERIELDLEEEIRNLYFDKSGQHIIVTTNAEVRVFPLTIAQRYRKNAS